MTVPLVGEELPSSVAGGIPALVAAAAAGRATVGPGGGEAAIQSARKVRKSPFCIIYKPPGSCCHLPHMRTVH